MFDQTLLSVSLSIGFEEQEGIQDVLLEGVPVVTLVVLQVDWLGGEVESHVTEIHRVVLLDKGHQILLGLLHSRSHLKELFNFRMDSSSDLSRGVWYICIILHLKTFRVLTFFLH